MFIEIVLSTFKVSLSEVQGHRGGIWRAGGDRKHTCSRGAPLSPQMESLHLGSLKQLRLRGRASAGLGSQVTLRCEDEQGCPGRVCSGLRPRCRLT